MVNKKTIGIVVVVLVVLAVIAVLTTGILKTQPSTTTTTLATTSIFATTTIPATPANSTVTKLFINESKLAAIFGTGGHYAVYIKNTPAQLQSSTSLELKTYNITAEYNMTYNESNIVSGQVFSSNVISEVIFPTVKSKALYSHLVSQYPYFNETLLKAQGGSNISSGLNLTIPGFTYSYSTFSFASTTQIVSLGVLFGYNNNSVAVVSLLQQNSSVSANMTQIAKLVAANLTIS